MLVWVRVCMCAYVCVCEQKSEFAFLCVMAYQSVYLHVSMYSCMPTCKHSSEGECVYPCVSVCICVTAWVSIHMYLYMNVYVCLHTCVFVHVSVPVCLYVNMSVCECVYLYVSADMSAYAVAHCRCLTPTSRAFSLGRIQIHISKSRFIGFILLLYHKPQNPMSILCKSYGILF